MPTYIGTASTAVPIYYTISYVDPKIKVFEWLYSNMCYIQICVGFGSNRPLRSNVCYIQKCVGFGF